MKIILAAVALMTVVAGPSASAQTPPSTRVSYADLDVASTAGKTTLKARIERAAHSVCGGFNSDFDLAGRAAGIQCYKAAVGNAMSQFNSRTPQFASR
jgi:UrcA family protein